MVFGESGSSSSPTTFATRRRRGRLKPVAGRRRTAGNKCVAVEGDLHACMPELLGDQLRLLSLRY